MNFYIFYKNTHLFLYRINNIIKRCNHDRAF
nr:MAG TPA: hypothetical protein [Caudoviricetes sp.]